MSEKEEIAKFNPYGDRGTRAIRWKKWIRSFELFIDAKGITDTHRKKASLLHYAGVDVQDIFDTLPTPEPTDQDDEYRIAKEMLTTKFSVSGNEAFESLKFRDMTPTENESIDSFLVRLRNQAAVCGFIQTEIDRHIRDQIVVKCPFKDLRMKLIDERDALTLDRALELYRAYEQSRIETSAMDNISSTVEQVQKLKLFSQPKPKSKGKSEAIKEQKQLCCWKCGGTGHLSKSLNCPAKGKRCNNCGYFNHFARVCRAAKKKKGGQKVRNLNSMDDKNEGEFLFSVKNINSNKNEYVNCIVGTVEIPMIIDSGASCNVIGKKEWERLKSSKIKCKTYFVNKKLYSYGEKIPLKVLGAFKADIEIKNSNKLENVEFFVFDGEGSSLLGKETAIKLNILRLGPIVNNVSDQNYNNYDESVVKNFNDVFHGIGKLKDYQLKIPIKLNAKGVAQPVRRLPYNLRPHVEKLINELLQHDIVEKVNGPTPWVSPIVVTPKKGGNWRLCVDMRIANLAIERERFPLPTVDEILQELNGSKVFSKLDIKWAYHQIELEEKSRNLTTFCTHIGLFRYKRLMFGVNCGPEMYQRVMTQTFQNCPGVCIYMDDIIVHGENESAHDKHLKKVLSVLREKGLTLNKEKCKFGLKEIIFLNHHISGKGIQPTEKNKNDVENFRPPKTVSEVRSFLGLVNFSSKFIPNLATIAEPLRRLTKKEEPFIWGKQQDEAFNNLKKIIVNPPILGFYDPNAVTRIYCDASPVGLGAILVQIQNDEPRIIRYASKALNSVEKRYSQTEKEAFALVWACEAFHIYTFGKEFELVTDHKPLETIFGPHHRSCARIERWILRLMSYSYKVVYKPGKTNIADPLSRLLDCRESENNKEEEEIQNIVEASVPVALTLRDIKEGTQKDENLQELSKSLRTNYWTKNQRQYEIIKDELCEIDGIILRGTRIVCPIAFQRKCLELAHEGHLGMTSMKRLLRSKVWWNNMDKDVDHFVKTCHGCQLVAVPDPPECMTRTELPSEPWEYISMDHMGPLPTGEHLLVIVDYYSRFFEVIITRSLSAQTLINQMMEMFARYGLPKYVMTDNAGTFIDKNFKKFLKERGCKHYHSTPLWPQANGQVERQNRSILKRLRIAHATGKNWRQELQDFLFAYRITPHSTTGTPPAELMFGRKVRSKLPDIKKSKDYPLDEDIRDRDKIIKDRGRVYSDKERRARESNIQPGDKVLMKQNRENKLMTNFKPSPMSVLARKGNAITVQDPNGQTYTRNTSHLKRYEQPEESIADNLEPETSEKYDALSETQCKSDVHEPPTSTNSPRRSTREKIKPIWHKDYNIG